jgi:xanthine dehydrogenase accessory factor
MMSAAASRRARELAEHGVAYVTATVVRAQRPTSAHAGDVAIVLADGTIEGFVGGSCAEHSVRVYSLAAIASGEAVLLRILPFDGGDGPSAGSTEREIAAGEEELAREEGSVTVQNPCLSGGAIEVFLEPVVPAPRVLVAGETPIAEALRRLGPEVGFDIVGVHEGAPEPARGDLGLVVATHGRDELALLRRALECDVPYVGLVASRPRGGGVLAELRADGISDERLAAIEVPAGIDIGARTPGEVAVSILARIVETRRTGTPVQALAVAAPTVAVDPVCGMSVAAVAATPSFEHDGQIHYFCCEGCRSQFEAGLERTGRRG